MSLIAHKTALPVRIQTKRFHTFIFNGKEKDYESGFHYYGARYYWSEVLTMWLSVDPMADKYPSLSPYAYCAWNPVKLIDSYGDSIKNGYEKYKKVDDAIQYFNNLIAKSSDKEIIQKYNFEIEKLKTNNKNYHKIEGVINGFIGANKDEFDKINKLEYNGKPVNIYIGLSTLKCDDNGGVGITIIPYEMDKDMVMDIAPLGIRITLYQNAFADGYNGVGSLANEFGDAIFGITRAQYNFETDNIFTNYMDKPSTKFSFDYENYITSPTKTKKPNPNNY